MKTIEIFDTTLRDGEQALGKRLKGGVKSKVAIARHLEELGVTTIEAGFPISSPADMEAVQQICRVVSKPYVAALARTTQKDIEAAYEAVKGYTKPTIHVFTYMVNADALRSYKVTPERVIEESVAGVKHARQLLGSKDRVEFSAQNLFFALIEAMTNEDYKALEFLKDLYAKTIAAGADVVNLPDTEGRVTPDQVGVVVDYFKHQVPNIKDAIISVHCHNDLGLATANSLQAVRSGAGQVECTINGLGERAGNAALEEVVMGIWTHTNRIRATTNIQTPLLGEISRIVSEHSGWDVQPNKAVVGENALQHSSGIHQDGNAKGSRAGTRIYQIFDAETVGWTGESTRLTARSGKQGVQRRLERLGYDISVEDVGQIVMPHFIQVADQHTEVTDIDLRLIMDEVYPPKTRLVYVDHEIVKGMGSPFYSAKVRLIIDGEAVTSDHKINSHVSDSVGAIDALATAVDSIVPIQPDERPTLVLYDPKNVGKAHSTQAEVTIVLSNNGFDNNFGLNQPVYIGRACHRDTLTASVMAYVDALNNYLVS